MEIAVGDSVATLSPTATLLKKTDGPSALRERMVRRTDGLSTLPTDQPVSDRPNYCPLTHVRRTGPVAIVRETVR